MSQNPPEPPEPPLPPRGPEVPDPEVPGPPGSLPWPARGTGGTAGAPAAEPAPAPGAHADPDGPDLPAGVYRRRRILLGVGVVAAVALLVGGLVWWQSDGGSDSSPEATVRAFFDASMDQDCEELIDLVVERSWSQDGTVDRQTAIDQCNADLATDVDFDAELHEVDVTSEDDGEAVVQVSYTLEGEQIDTRLDLVEEDGDWKVTGV